MLKNRSRNHAPDAFQECPGPSHQAPGSPITLGGEQRRMKLWWTALTMESDRQTALKNYLSTTNSVLAPYNLGSTVDLVQTVPTGLLIENHLLRLIGKVAPPLIATPTNTTSRSVALLHTNTISWLVTGPGVVAAS